MKNEEQTPEDNLETLMSTIWPGGYENPLIHQGVNRDKIKKIIEHAPREICDLLGKLEECNEIYGAKDTQTPQALFQCEDITPPSQQPSFFSFFWSTPPIPTKQYSIKVDGKNDFILGITRERQQGVYYLDSKPESELLRELAVFWTALHPTESPQSFLKELNQCIADQASNTQSNSL